MSHFRTVVLVDKDVAFEDVKDEVTRLLAPFDENTEVEPYRDYFKHNPQSTDHGAEAGYCSLCSFAESYGIARDDLPALALRMEDWTGNPGGVDEQGLYQLSRYNPQSQWDWWVIGGRYDGWLTQQARYDNGAWDAHYSELAETLSKNCARVRDLPPPRLITKRWNLFGTESEELPPEEQYYGHPYALVTPDGEWHSQGKMGWFGLSSDDESEIRWSARYFEILSAHPECWAVVCDLHI